MNMRLVDWNPAIVSTIDQPGVYNLPADMYHADPVPQGSLSVSGARRLLPPSCPALFDHERKHGRAPKREWDFGHAAHKLVLGVGPELVVVDAEDWKTKDAREQRDQAREAGLVPLLAVEFEVVQAMAGAIRRHPIAAALLRPERGDAEQSMFWIDDETGVWRRAMADFLPHADGGRFILTDYKTCPCAADDEVERAVYRFGYHMQAAWYLDGVKALGLDRNPAFLLVFQEKTAPYLVHPVELSADALMAGRFYNRQALLKFAECTASGRWPGYGDDEISYLSLPGYAMNRYYEESGK